MSCWSCVVPSHKQKLPGLFADLKALLKDIDPVPNIVIDPTRFQKWGVTTVPEIVVEVKAKPPFASRA